MGKRSKICGEKEEWAVSSRQIVRRRRGIIWKNDSGQAGNGAPSV